MSRNTPARSGTFWMAVIEDRPTGMSSGQVFDGRRAEAKINQAIDAGKSNTKIVLVRLDIRPVAVFMSQQEK
jgi:hypothetical protein